MYYCTCFFNLNDKKSKMLPCSDNLILIISLKTGIRQLNIFIIYVILIILEIIIINYGGIK